MGLQSFTHCPSCESDIVMKKVRRGVFGCPHCHAEFRHNYTRWAIALPVMLVVTLCLFYFLPGLGIWIIVGGVAISSLVVSRSPEFVVERPGRVVEPHRMTPQQKESTFFKVSIFCFFLIAICAVGWSLIYLLKFLHK